MAATAIMFLLAFILLLSRALGITLDANRNVRQLTLESISHMRPPPLPPYPRTSGFPIRPGPNRSPTTQFTLPPQAIQQPSITATGNIRNLQNNFGNVPHNFPPGQHNRQAQLLESSSRKPQQFSDVQAVTQAFGFSVQDTSNRQPTDSFLAASAQQNSFSSQPQQFNTPPLIQQSAFPQSNRQGQKPSTVSSHQDSAISQRPINHQPKLLPSFSQQFSLNSHLQSSSQQIQHFPDNFIQQTFPTEQDLLIQNPWYQALPSELITAFNGTVSGGHFEQDALKITAPPVLGPAAQTVVVNEANKKALLKDIISEDCPRAKQDGFCASPPRYPSYQISQLISRCSEIIRMLYVPVPKDTGGEISEVQNDIEEKTLSLPHINSTREMQRGNRQLWSWARATVEQETACGSQRQWAEPGYARDNSGRWYVVLQARDSLSQHVHLETCHTPGKPCSAIKCSTFGNKLAASHCVQRYSYSHLIVWDPDQQDSCPHLRVFPFPTACVCHLGPP